MIRTTVRFEENLFKDARKLAIDKGLGFAELVNEALKNFLSKQPRVKKQKFEFKVYDMGKIKGSISRADIYEDI